MPIGMAQVSSVVMTAEKDSVLQKGQEFAYFQMGGSDYILVFEATINLEVLVVPKDKCLQGVPKGDMKVRMF
jgi:phosphatidylserine decarboxylase